MMSRRALCAVLLACAAGAADAQWWPRGGPQLPSPDSISCFLPSNLTWKSAPGRLLLHDVQIHLKGLNWFGLNQVDVLEGTSKRSVEEIFTFLTRNQINALRIPFSAKFALSSMNATWPDREIIAEEFHGLTSWQILDEIFERAAEAGILVMLDMHTLDPSKAFISGLWYDEEYTEEMVLEGWRRVVKRYVKHWNLVFLDIKNEAWQASWGTGNLATDFNAYSERFIAHMDRHVPDFKGFFVVEGIYGNTAGKAPSRYQQWWGGNLFGAYDFPVSTGVPRLDDRIVYSPHIYGPDVYPMRYFDDPRFPESLNEVWDEQFAWLISKLQKAVILGEWGGSCNGMDGVVQERLAQWLVANCITDNMWWALPPGSVDTGGLMNGNWTKFDAKKMSVLDYVQVEPSSFSVTGGRVCVRRGQAPNMACRRDPVAVSRAGVTRSAQAQQALGPVAPQW